MKTLRIKPALRYQLEYIGWTFVWVIGIGLAASLLFSLFAATVTVGQVRPSVEVDLAGLLVVRSGVTFNLAGVMAFALFVIGIGGIREDLRLFIQHGIGRRTAYLSTLFAGLIVGGGIGLVCQLFDVINRAIPVFPLVGLGYYPDNFFVGWLTHAFILLLAWQLGTMISLIYYRLSKIGAIIFSVAAGATFLFGIGRLVGGLIRWLEANNAEDLLRLFDFARSPVTMLASIIAVSALAAAGNYLLIRRAQIKEPGS